MPTALKDVCPFPGCALDCEHDGDHAPRTAFPVGELRRLQWFEGLSLCPVCEVHAETSRVYAIGFYVDSRGNGWLLCSTCVTQFMQ